MADHAAMASRYDDELWELVPENPGPPPEHLVRFVSDLPEAECALDLGCGDGRLTLHLRAKRLTAADVSATALGRASGRLDGAEAVELEPDAPLPFEDSSFDLALCAETIEHVRDVSLLLSELRRVLAPKGRLALTTPAHGRATGLAAATLGFDREFEPLSPHLRFFTRRSLRELLTGHGFDIESLRRRSGTLLAVATR